MAKESFAVAKAIGERVLLPKVRALDENVTVIADGFSCREQIEMHGGRKALHLVELLRERIQ
jgi:Fe-S oxidoreductase